MIQVFAAAKAILAAFAAVPKIIESLERIANIFDGMLTEMRKANLLKDYDEAITHAIDTGDTSELEKAWRFGRIGPNK